MLVEESGSHVFEGPDGEDTQYNDYTVTSIEPGDMPKTLTPRMEAFLRDHGNAVPVIASVQDLAAAVQARVTPSHSQDA